MLEALAEVAEVREVNKTFFIIFLGGGAGRVCPAGCPVGADTGSGAGAGGGKFNNEIIIFNICKKAVAELEEMAVLEAQEDGAAVAQ